jgi:hypothetical protein
LSGAGRILYTKCGRKTGRKARFRDSAAASEIRRKPGSNSGKFEGLKKTKDIGAKIR